MIRVEGDRFLSLGAGVQSSAMYALCTIGDLPRPKQAIFADTGCEPRAVYEWLQKLEAWGEKYNGPPIVKVTKGDLFMDHFVGTRVSMIPAYVINDRGGVGRLRRQCTRDYKLVPLARQMREAMGVSWKGPCRHVATVMIGISKDEEFRARNAKPPSDKSDWQRRTYPLLDLNLTRTDCKEITQIVGMGIPPKSACIICPYHSDISWLQVKRDKEDWETAVWFDYQIRDWYKTGRAGITGPMYLHQTCKPLDKIKFEYDDTNPGLSEECLGICGV